MSLRLRVVRAPVPLLALSNPSLGRAKRAGQKAAGRSWDCGVRSIPVHSARSEPFLRTLCVSRPLGGQLVTDRTSLLVWTSFLRRDASCGRVRVPSRLHVSARQSQRESDTSRDPVRGPSRYDGRGNADVSDR